MNLTSLQMWYLSNCDGDWEHQSGIKIETLDNPGWRVSVSPPQGISFDKDFSINHQNEDDENDWIICRIEGDNFVGYSGPTKLNEIVRKFLEFVNFPN